MDRLDNTLLLHITNLDTLHRLYITMLFIYITERDTKEKVFSASNVLVEDLQLISTSSSFILQMYKDTLFSKRQKRNIFNGLRTSPPLSFIKVIKNKLQEKIVEVNGR